MKLHWSDAAFCVFVIVGVIALVIGETTLGLVCLAAAVVMMVVTGLGMAKRGAERRIRLREGRSERAEENKPESD